MHSCASKLLCSWVRLHPVSALVHTSSSAHANQAAAPTPAKAATKRTHAPKRIKGRCARFQSIFKV
eukprot:6196750-Pleurochrysis_carterae.AAC.1